VAHLPPWPYPKRCAHRGAGKLAPENTLASLRLGHSHGYRMAEVDVKLSADGVPFLLHDTTLERTTSGHGRADALTWRELSRLDAGSWHSAPYAGEPLPTLSAVARWCRANGVALNIEIKPTPGRERETGAAVALDAAALWKGSDVPPLLSSFSATALARPVQGARLRRARREAHAAHRGRRAERAFGRAARRRVDRQRCRARRGADLVGRGYGDHRRRRRDHLITSTASAMEVSASEGYRPEALEKSRR